MLLHAKRESQTLASAWSWLLTSYVHAKANACDDLCMHSQESMLLQFFSELWVLGTWVVGEVVEAWGGGGG